MTYVHSMDPFIIEFGQGVGIRWYGIAYLAGFICAYFVIKYMAQRRSIQMKPEQVSDYVTLVAIGTMVGGRLGYCLFYKPETLFDFTSSFPYWEVLAVHKGGMASHGGIAGIIITCIWLGKKYGYNSLRMIDLAAIMGGIGIMFGRIANFINGELFGRAVSKGFSAAVKFPTELHYWYSYQTDKLKDIYPVVDVLKNYKPELVNQFTDESMWIDFASKFKYNGQVRYQMSQIIDQIILTSQNRYEDILVVLEPVLTARYPSQLYQATMEGFVVFLCCFIVWLKPRKPGVVAGVFGITYSLMRTLGEQFRMPDAHIGYDLLGLTRGQWLSVGLLIFSIGLIVYSLKQKTKPSGGFLVPNQFK